MPTTNYTTTQAWNAPPDCRNIDSIWAVGGGAAGQAGQAAQGIYGGYGGYGGGGGASALKYNIPCTPGEAFTIYVGGEGGYSGLLSGPRGWLVLAYSGSGQSAGSASVGDGLYNGTAGGPQVPPSGGVYPNAGSAGGGTNGFTSGGGGAGGAPGTQFVGNASPGGNATNWGAGGGGGGGGYYVDPNPGAGGAGGAGYSGIVQLSYTSSPAPTVSSCSPNTGSTLGGTSVTITGANFVGAASATFGGVAATSVVLVNSTTITCITPAHAAGAVNVVVTTGGMTGTGTNLFTYRLPSSGFNMPMMGI